MFPKCPQCILPQMLHWNIYRIGCPSGSWLTRGISNVPFHPDWKINQNFPLNETPEGGLESRTPDTSDSSVFLQHTLFVQVQWMDQAGLSYLFQFHCHLRHQPISQSPRIFLPLPDSIFISRTWAWSTQSHRKAESWRAKWMSAYISKMFFSVAGRHIICSLNIHLQSALMKSGPRSTSYRFAWEL